MAQKGFDPIYTAQSRALILGTWPSPKSFEYGFYYGHKQNRFWPLLARLTGCNIPATIGEKCAMITENGLALWDTIENCRITGASDASIKEVEPRNICWLLEQAPIEAIFCNGAKAYDIYMKHQYPKTGIKAVKLPSTSPANAAFSLDRLEELWSPLKRYIK